MSSGATGGLRILDRYVMHAEIASGGMASVHLGQVRGAAGFARAVAIKRLHPQFAKDPEFSSMFLDEAHLAARISHPNVISVIDVVAGDGELFLVMEYVAGESLANLLRQANGVAPPPPVAVAIVAGALAGLHAAHEARSDTGEPLHIVHRDVSPQNVLVGRDGSARVLDFGIAHAAVRSHATREGQVKGKLRYMAPEQLRGDVATRKSDVYAAAVVLWETLTGEKLFAADTDVALYGRILEGVVQPPSRFVAVPRALDEVVLRALSRDRDRRYSTALEMAHALEAALAPALARDVGAWVERVAGGELAARAAKLADIEAGIASRRFASAPPPASSDAAPREPAENTSPPLVAALSTRPREAGTATHTDVAAAARTGRRGGATRWIVVAAAIGSIGGGVFAVRSRSSVVAAPEARRGIAAAGLLASLAADRESVRAAANASASPATPSTDPSAEPAITAPIVAPPRARGIPITTRSRCDPPYTVDAAGIRRVKRECL